MEVSIVLETFNCLEGSTLGELRAAIRAASACVRSEATEILLANAKGNAEIRRMIAEEFPAVRCIDAVGLGYDQAKMLAARESRGRIVAYLDGDCIPVGCCWLEKLIEPIRAGMAVASGGFSRYPHGFFSSILSIMDFGFLLPRSSQKLGCYAFNNAAFLRDVLLQVPVPDGPLRCGCYLHAQKLRRSRTPVMMAPDAVVIHGLPPTMRERLRRGYDAIAVCWVDTSLREAKWLRMGIFAAPFFYAEAVKFDWKRIRSGYKEFDLHWWQMFLALPIFPVLRLIDLVGMSGALLFGPKSRKWLDWGSRRYVTPNRPDGRARSCDLKTG